MEVPHPPSTRKQMLLIVSLFTINKAADYLLFVRNTIIIKHSGEINMLSRHAFDITVL